MTDWRGRLHRLTSFSTATMQIVKCEVCLHRVEINRVTREGIDAVRALEEFVCTGTGIALRRELVGRVV